MRRVLAGEVHSRPHEVLQAPLRASYIVMLTGEGGEPADRAHLRRLCESRGIHPPTDGNHFAADFGEFRLRWERHTEFTSYTIFRFDPFEAPFAVDALSLAPAGWLTGVPGEMLVGLHVSVEARERPLEEVRALFDGNSLAGSAMLGGAARAWTDFRLRGDGFGRILVHDAGMTCGQTGRLVQRLVEVETYRMMAAMALPVARASAPQVRALEGRLSEVVTAVADPRKQGEDRLLLDRLAQIAAEAERLATTGGYRFAAGRAYHQLVQQRIAELREERLPQLQMIAEFMERRLTPAMRSCEAAAARIERLAEDVSRAGSLLRTRVDIALEGQSRDLLHSMDRRARLQLRLQQTVEGLSVVAISYYVLGLLAYAAKGAKAAGVPVNPEVAVLVGLPAVVALVWLGVRRLRRAIDRGTE